MTAGPFRLEDADGIQALDPNQLMSLVQGNSVVSGLTPSYSGTGTDIDVASGTALVNGSEISVTATTITISNGDANNPRKDLLTVDSTGTVKVYEGTPEPAVPNGQNKFKTARPSPEDLNDRDEVALAEIWVPTGATSLQASYVRDRRVIGDLEVNSGEFHGDVQMNGNNINNASAVEATNLNDRQVPVGGIISWDKSRTNTPALPANYAECNGQTISDADSPYDGQTLPNLNGNNRFLRGNSTSGSTGGADSVNLSHSHGGSTGGANTGFNGGDGVTGTSGGYETHNHGIGSSLGSEENKPPYYEVVWVMRVK